MRIRSQICPLVLAFAAITAPALADSVAVGSSSSSGGSSAAAGSDCVIYRPEKK